MKKKTINYQIYKQPCTMTLKDSIGEILSTLHGIRPLIKETPAKFQKGINLTHKETSLTSKITLLVQILEWIVTKSKWKMVIILLQIQRAILTKVFMKLTHKCSKAVKQEINKIRNSNKRLRMEVMIKIISLVKTLKISIN